MVLFESRVDIVTSVSKADRSSGEASVVTQGDGFVIALIQSVRIQLDFISVVNCRGIFVGTPLNRIERFARGDVHLSQSAAESAPKEQHLSVAEASGVFNVS
jgi:hypothetical protein